MGEIGGTPRHFTGRDAQPGPIKWRCNSCGTEHVSRFEEGCPACGAGVPSAAPAQQGPVISEERLVEEIVGVEAAALASATYWLGLPFLTLKARQSIAVALSHYADHGASPTTAELPRQVALSWAQRLNGEIEAELTARDEAARQRAVDDSIPF